MPKQIVVIICIILLPFSIWSQNLSVYYQAAEGLSGDTLHYVLHNIIKNHTEFPYTSSNTDTWDILKESDSDPVNSAKVVMVYSGWLRNKVDEYPQWSREHVWAKSHGDFGTAMGAGTDLHNLKPCDVSVNSARSNKDFDEGGSQYIDGDGATQCYTSTYTWEPRDEVKGDIARIILYMDVRYEGDPGEVDLEVVDYVNTATSYQPYHGKLSTLLQWHIDDPVDSFEINRNNVIYSYQNNRNPFIDHPEYVSYIWMGGSPVVSVQQDILLQQGWSIISSNIEFQEDSIPVIFLPVVSSLILLKNNDGTVYWPQYALNMIGDHVVGQGYFCKMSSTQILSVEGPPVDVSQSSISLTAGWNTIGYLPQVSTTTYIALSSILSSILIMKDGSGNVFWPAFGVDLIGILTPGKGYQINMSAPAVFFYPLL